jgi:hypothetical protein
MGLWRKLYVIHRFMKIKKTNFNSNSSLTWNASHFPQLKTKGPTPFQPPRKAPSWPTTSSTISDIEGNPTSHSSCLELLKLGNFVKIKSCIQNIVQCMKSPVDITSQICSVIEHVIDIYSP